MSLSDEIKSKLTALDYAHRLGLEFDRANKLAKCPWHEDENPSLSFKDNFCKCFACNNGGSAIDLHMIVKKTDQKTAIHELANLLNLKTGRAAKTTKKRTEKPLPADQHQGDDNLLPEPKTLKEAPKTKDFSALYDAFLDTCEFPDPSAMNYLTGPRRGLKEDTIRRFRIRQIKDYAAIKRTMQVKFDKADLIDSGLFNDKENLIFYKHTLVIPYSNLSGKTEYLRGRYFWEGSPDSDQKDVGKMLGLTGHTAKVLYNIDTIRTMNEGDKLVICEGEFDAMILEQNEVRAIGLPGMNNWDPEYIPALKAFKIILLLDNPKPEKERADWQAEMTNIKNVIDRIASSFYEKGKTIQIMHLPVDVKDVTEEFSKLPF